MKQAILTATLMMLGPTGASGQSAEPSDKVSQPASSQSRQQARPYATPASHSSATLEAVFETSGVPGIAAALSVRGEIVWEQYLGFSNLQERIPTTADTRFRIGSVSKAVTAVVLARLWQKGRIDLDADIRRYVPEFPDKGAMVTPRLLAGHLGGIRNYESKDFADSTHIDRRHFAHTSEALTLFADDPLVGPPGDRYHYSVFGYTLLSAAMEGAAESDFLTLLDRFVTEPLGLHQTGADSMGVQGRAVAYERTSDGGATIADPLDFSYKWAGGGLHSNVRDLARLGSALLDPDFLSPAARELMTTSQVTSSGDSTNVSLGWRLGEDSRGRRFIHHAGSIAGGRTVLLVYPDRNLSVAITSNQALAPLMIESTAQVLAEPFLLEQERKTFSRIRQVGRYRYEWRAAGIEHKGILRYGADEANDRIDLHPELGAWSATLGSSLSETATLLPMLLVAESAFLPVITPAGAFAIDATFGSNDSFSGIVSGHYLRVSGPFRAERLEPR